MATLATCLLALGACGGGGGGSSVVTNTDNPVLSATDSSGSVSDSGQPPAAQRARVPSGDWTRFDYNAERSGVGPASTGITTRNLNSLRLRRIQLDGTVDSSPIQLHALRVRGRVRDVVFATTTYGRTIALDPGTGTKLWEYVPPDIRRYEGTYQITNTTPVADPGRRYLYAASPDGLIRKLSTTTGHEVRSGNWPARVTLLPAREKLAAALNLSGNSVIATTGGYIGDAPPYQGHVALVDRATGRVNHVWNSLCSDRRRLIQPSSCQASDSAIWSRAGAVVEPGSGRLLVATGNAPFNGRTNWGDSALELSADATRLLHNWTPSNQADLNDSDTDLGSTSPALLPTTSGVRLAVQGGKEGNLALINLDRTPLGATGGELQRISAPGGSAVFTAPVVWTHGGRTNLFVANDAGMTSYQLIGGTRPRLRVAAQGASAGTSPVLAGGLLYIYDSGAPALRVYDPSSLKRLASLPLSGTGHWNSPIVIGGRIIVPEGNANDHRRSGQIEIYHLPGR
ncbi:MAG: PQQ-binding-like beta-propeller repeat protein [Solirubrobacteraceae bacterium]